MRVKVISIGNAESGKVRCFKVSVRLFAVMITTLFFSSSASVYIPCCLYGYWVSVVLHHSSIASQNFVGAKYFYWKWATVIGGAIALGRPLSASTSAMSNPWAAWGPVEGFLWPSLSFRSSIRVIPCQIIKKKTILNPTVSEFNEIWHTCWFQPPNLKSKIIQWSDDWFPRYGG